jgi:hypothetical protein
MADSGAFKPTTDKYEKLFASFSIQVDTRIILDGIDTVERMLNAFLFVFDGSLIEESSILYDQLIAARGGFRALLQVLQHPPLSTEKISNDVIKNAELARIDHKELARVAEKMRASAGLSSGLERKFPGEDPLTSAPILEFVQLFYDLEYQQLKRDIGLT